MLENLELCNHCGGCAEYDVEYIETEFGTSRFVGLMCSNCKSRTTMYMCEKDDPKITDILKDLWNRGRITKIE